jgi:hypothetical protein
MRVVSVTPDIVNAIMPNSTARMPRINRTHQWLANASRRGSVDMLFSPLALDIR